MPGGGGGREPPDFFFSRGGRGGGGGGGGGGGYKWDPEGVANREAIVDGASFGAFGPSAIAVGVLRDVRKKRSDAGRPARDRWGATRSVVGSVRKHQQGTSKIRWNVCTSAGGHPVLRGFSKKRWPKKNW